MGKPRERSRDDEDLVARFLDRTARLSEAEAGATIEISGTQVGKYRRGQWKALMARTRRAMEEYLGYDVVDPDEQWRAGVRFAADRVRGALEELDAVLDAVREK